ncbi:MAG: helix-turn-helix domain-containing protein [Rhodospirillaceae bacterium]|nr:MAG: helix-turn-helix domain-containing protein [Rhodospirillaceae bacterium]
MVQNAGLGVGSLLRQRREELGQDIEAVSRQLRIRAIYIRAIEEGRLQDLPGTAYAVGFVRTYADFLGFDGNIVVADYRDELGQRTRTEPVSWRMEERESHFPGGKLLIVCLILAGIGYGGWYYLSNTPTGAGLIESVPDYLKKNSGEAETSQPAEAPKTAETAPATAGEGTAPEGPAGEGAANSSTDSAPATTDGSTATTPETGAAGEAPTNSNTGSATGDAAAQAGTEGNSASSAPSTEGTGSPAPADSAAAGASGEANQTAAAPAENGTASADVAAAAASTATRVNIRAKLESWVQIVDKDGKPILSRVLRAGETYSVPDEAGLVMSTGNAGGIEMLLDGKPLQNLGAVGLVRRNIPLDPDKLASGAAFLKTPSPAPASGGRDNSGD